MESPIVISPGNTILFKGSHKNLIESSFTIKNNSTNFICFNNKTSPANDFKIFPVSSVINPKEEVHVQVVFVGLQESKNKGQKILIQITFGSELSQVDWKSKDILEFKLGTKFNVQDIDEKLTSSFNKDSEDSFTSENATFSRKNQLDDKGLEYKYQGGNKKVVKIARFREGDYLVPHILLSFVVGVFIGFYLLA